MNNDWIILGFDAEGKAHELVPEVAHEGAVTLIKLKKEDAAGFARLDLLPELAKAQNGETGYYAMPTHYNGCISHFCDCKEHEWEVYPSLFFFGARTARGAVAVMPEGMKYEMMLCRAYAGGFHRLFFRLNPAKEHFDIYEDITLRIVLLPDDADYNDMAKAYRDYKYAGGLKMLKDKGPAALYTAAAPEIRVRMGWKPVPSPVKEQTEETEPPMHVAVTFAQVAELAKRLKANGVEKAQFCLVGWNKSGHDGRWPEAFPVEEKLGGEEGLKKCIREVQALGYKIVCHTNSSDAYSIAKSFDKLKLLRDAEGKLSFSERGWSGGHQYRLCASDALRLARETFPRVRELGFEGTHYIDVLSVVVPYRCYDPAHPMNRKQTVIEWKKVLRLARETFGGVSSEGCFDTLAEDLDFGLYTGFCLFSRQLDEFQHEVIPLWELVYHGAVTSCPDCELVNITLNPQAKRLKFLEFAGRPAMYIHSRFVTENGKDANWMGKDDLTMGSPEEVERTVNVLTETSRFFEKLAFLQKEKLLRHDKLSDTLVRLTYSGAWRLYINYADAPVTVDGTTVSAEDYALVQGKNT